MDYKIVIGLIVVSFLLILLTACTPTKKIEFGKQCTKDGSVYSYVWIKDASGETDVNKNNCK